MNTLKKSTGSRVKTRAIRTTESTNGFTSETPKRTKRIPLGQRKAKLKAPELEGFYQRWMNVGGTRIDDAVAAGYEFVKKDGKKVSAKINRGDSSKIAYLMKLPMDLRKQDLLAKRKVNQATIEAIEESKAAVGGSYDPENKKLSQAHMKQMAEYFKHNNIKI